MAELVGANVRRLRHEAGANLEDLASFARAHDLPWSTGMVANIEHGRAAPNLTTLLVVAAALSQLLGREVRLAELFEGTGPVAISDTSTVDAATVQAALSGGVVTPLALASKWRAKIRPLGLRGFRESDERMCKQLGISREQGIEAMGELWGHSFSTERDRRAGADANAQRRGQISRQLKADLQNRISSGDN
jgi:transcriptional regulator with XRE-family HTH domain